MTRVNEEEGAKAETELKTHKVAPSGRVWHSTLWLRSVVPQEVHCAFLASGNCTHGTIN